jgi:hypothetical protein
MTDRTSQKYADLWKSSYRRICDFSRAGEVMFKLCFLQAQGREQHFSQRLSQHMGVET